MKNQNNTQTQFSKLSSPELLKSTVTALKNKNFIPVIIDTKEEALKKIKELIPKGASVMNGASLTLEQIGYMDYLNSRKHSWIDLHAKIGMESNETKRHELRKQSVLSDFYIGSVHAITEDGQLVIASNTGSQLPHIVFTSPNLVFVISTKKIVKDFNQAMKRLEEYVVPLEDERMQKAMGMHTQLNKIVILKNDPEFLGRKIYILLVKEDLGF